MGAQNNTPGRLGGAIRRVGRALTEGETHRRGAERACRIADAHVLRGAIAMSMRDVGSNLKAAAERDRVPCNTL
jgi:hypothetical protein